MNKFSLLMAGILIAIGILGIMRFSPKKVSTVYACRVNEPTTECRNYRADIVHDSMDGSYVKAMYSTDDSSSPIAFEPISNDDSKERGCWLGSKHGVNGLEYSLCTSSFGEWIILEAPNQFRL